jgi:hypothetical protein
VWLLPSVNELTVPSSQSSGGVYMRPSFPCPYSTGARVGVGGAKGKGEKSRAGV